MKKVGRKFTAKKKLAILNDWDGTASGAARMARINSCSSASIWLWSAKVKHLTTDDEKLNVLENKSSRPRNFRNPHTQAEDEMVKTISLEYPGICRQELYYRLRVERAYSRSIRTMYRAVRRLNILPVAELEKYIAKPYDTPKMPGIKWQLDLKYVPLSCLPECMRNNYCKADGGARWYQYTCIDECTRERFTWVMDSFGAAESIEFFKRCIIYFGYKPYIVQTDNGSEFANSKLSNRKHVFTKFLNSLNIKHNQIRPYCPRQNGKVERSHRTDNECFYNHSRFESLADARAKNKQWLIRYNTKRPSSALCYKTPAQVRDQLLAQLHQQNIAEFQGKQFQIRFIQTDRNRAFAD